MRLMIINKYVAVHTNEEKIDTDHILTDILILHYPYRSRYSSSHLPVKM